MRRDRQTGEIFRELGHYRLAIVTILNGQNSTQLVLTFFNKIFVLPISNHKGKLLRDSQISNAVYNTGRLTLYDTIR